MKDKNMIQTSNKYTRINKTKARRLFYQGKDIYIVPCNVSCDFSNMWILPYKINTTIDFHFDTAINNFEYYNCNDKETGLYPAYYID